jgi:hypothetical protein
MFREISVIRESQLIQLRALEPPFISHRTIWDFVMESVL